MAKLVKKINSNSLNGYFSIEFVRPPVLHIIQYMVRLHPSPTAAPQLIIPEKTVVLPEYQELRLGGDELQAHSRVFRQEQTECFSLVLYFATESVNIHC